MFLKDELKPSWLAGVSKSTGLRNDDHETDTTTLDASASDASASDTSADSVLWPWRVLLLGITVCWGANFALVKQAADSLGDAAEAITMFTAARFVLGFALLSPSLIKTSSREVVVAGASVGALTTLGYAAQVASVTMGTAAGTAAFICSLNAVVVAVMIGQKTGFVSPRTWYAIGLSVLGVACLELPSILSGGGGLCLGDIVAFGQPLGFGASYVLLEQALADHPEDELPIAAMQVLTTCLAALAAASVAYGEPLWALPWADLLPRAVEVASTSVDAAVSTLDAAADGATSLATSLVVPAVSASAVAAATPPPATADWSVTGPLLYSGVITSALTIWLQMVVFAKLPAVDASVLLTTEPLWAALAAVWLLGDRLGASDYAGGALIVLALCVNQGLVGPSLPEVSEVEAAESSN